MAEGSKGDLPTSYAVLISFILYDIRSHLVTSVKCFHDERPEIVQGLNNREILFFSSPGDG